MIEPLPYPFPTDDCFFCGEANPIGPQLRYSWDDERQEVVGEHLLAERFKGQGDILHGGIQFGIIDEAMGWATIHVYGMMAVTLDLKLKLIRPLYVLPDEPIRSRCRIVERQGDNIHLEAELSDAAGNPCTLAGGRFRVLDDDAYWALIRPGGQRS